MFVIRNGSHLSLNQIHLLHKGGASILRSAHLGNLNAATLFLAQEGFKVILDEHITGKFRGYKPGVLKVGGRELVLADEIEIPLTHVRGKVGMESETRRFVSRAVTRPSQFHYEALAGLYPNSIALTSSFLLEQEPFLIKVLEALVVNFPEAFRKYISTEGEIFRFSHTSDDNSSIYINEKGDEILVSRFQVVDSTVQYYHSTRDSIEGDASPQQGIVLSPVADILLLTICDIYKGRIGTVRYHERLVSVIHFAGVEMMNYLIKNTVQARENSQKFNDIYGCLYTLFPDVLPQQVEFLLVPTSNLAQLLTDNNVLADQRSQAIEQTFQLDAARAAERTQWAEQSRQAMSKIEMYSDEEIKLKIRELYSRISFLPKRVRAEVLRAIDYVEDIDGHRGFLVSTLTKQYLFESKAYPNVDTAIATTRVVQDKLLTISVNSCPGEVLEVSQCDLILGKQLFFPGSARKLPQDDLRARWKRVTNIAAHETGSTHKDFESRYDFSSIREKAMKGPRVTSLLPVFESIASGDSLVPKVPVTVATEFLAQHPEYREYCEVFSKNVGAFNMHAFASIPFLMEENIRVGVAILALATHARKRGKLPFTIYSTSSADDTHGRALAEYSKGLIKTFSDSPNPANATQFHRHLSHQYSFHHTGPFVDITRELLLEKGLADFASGFDVIWENTTFQMYGNNRDEQIAYVRRVLKHDGIIIFLEKLNQIDRAEYQRREHIKDTLFKSRYFTDEEIAQKKSSILSEMEKGQVTLSELTQEIKRHFTYVYQIWNSANFYEVAASNSKPNLDLFLSSLPEPYVPKEFACEVPMVRAL